MSIYTSMPGVDDEEPCGPPWIYQGSHILPADDDPRGGEIGLALIPSYITRDGRDDQPEDGKPWPWLRMSIVDSDGINDVILTPAQARHLAEQLAGWADLAEAVHRAHNAQPSDYTLAPPTEEKVPMTDTDPCPHCPDGHTPPDGGSQPWCAWVGPQRDGDGQPTQITVARSGGAHVAESDAQWIRDRLNGDHR